MYSVFIRCRDFCRQVSKSAAVFESHSLVTINNSFRTWGFLEIYSPILISLFPPAATKDVSQWVTPHSTALHKTIESTARPNPRAKHGISTPVLPNFRLGTCVSTGF